MVEFLEHSRPLLYSKPVLYAQMISILEMLQDKPNVFGEASPYALLIVDQHEQVLGAALRTPPFPMQVTELSEAEARALVEFVEEYDPLLPGVLGPGADSWKFAREFCKNARIPDLRLHMTLYCLREVECFGPGNGVLRQCGSADFEHLYQWAGEFADDCGLPHGRPSRERVQKHLDDGSYYYWEVGNEPVGMLRRHVNSANQCARINSVFTPLRWRGRGYGLDGTATLTQKCLDEGARYVTLVADVKNATSNGLYQRVGFRPVEDLKLFEFQAK